MWEGTRNLTQRDNLWPQAGEREMVDDAGEERLQSTQLAQNAPYRGCRGLGMSRE